MWWRWWWCWWNRRSLGWRRRRCSPRWRWWLQWCRWRWMWHSAGWWWWWWQWWWQQWWPRWFWWWWSSPCRWRWMWRSAGCCKVSSRSAAICGQGSPPNHLHPHYHNFFNADAGVTRRCERWRTCTWPTCWWPTTAARTTSLTAPSSSDSGKNCHVEDSKRWPVWHQFVRYPKIYVNKCRLVEEEPEELCTQTELQDSQVFFEDSCQ